MTLTHLNPQSLATNPVFSQGVLVEGGSLLVVGGQNGIDAEDKIVGEDVESQSAQAFRNVIAVLEEGARRPPTSSSSRCIWLLRLTFRLPSQPPKRYGGRTQPLFR